MLITLKTSKVSVKSGFYVVKVLVTSRQAFKTDNAIIQKVVSVNSGNTPFFTYSVTFSSRYLYEETYAINYSKLKLI